MSRVPLAAVSAAFALVGLAAGQSDAIVGTVRDHTGEPLVGALVRAFPAPPLSLPWLDAPSGPPATCRTDAHGRFALPLDRRAALWIEAETEGALVAEAAPGVPSTVETARLGVLLLEAGARGVWLRVDGVPLGFAPGTEVRVPAGAAEMLVETEDGPFAATHRVAPGERFRPMRPASHPAVLRGLASGASVRVLPWLERTFAPDDDGVVRVPRTERALRLRITTADGAAEAFDELWLEPGDDLRLAPAPLVWHPLRVRDGAGRPVTAARVVTLRLGSGEPTIAASSPTDAAGVGRYRAGVELGRVVVLAEGHATAATVPGQPGETVRLGPGRVAMLRVVDDRGAPIASARVATRIDAAIDRVARTDGRGEIALQRLPAGPFAVTVDHPEHPPLEADVDPHGTEVAELVMGRGLELSGVVTAADPSYLRGVVVEVRDPTGRTGMQPRFTQTDAAGRFAFRGLPDYPLTLFARCTERGKTWSGTAHGVYPGEEPVGIAIECDDPTPAGRAHDG